MAKRFNIIKVVICFDEENYISNYSKTRDIKDIGARISHCLVDLDEIIKIMKNYKDHTDIISYVDDEIIIYHDNMFVHIEEDIPYNTSLEVNKITDGIQNM